MELNNFFNELDKIFKTKSIGEAEKFVLESLEKVQRNNDVPGLLAIANELGGIYRVTNRFEEAKKIYSVANDAIKLLGLENTQQHGTTLLNLASVYTESDNAQEALAIYDRVAAIFECAGLKNDYQMAALYNNMSHAYDKLNMVEAAITHAEKALKIIKNLPGNDVELATTYTTLATRYTKKQKYDEAFENLKEAERIFIAIPGKTNPHFAATLNSMGELYFYKGQNDEAKRCFEKALQIIKENYGENKSYFEVMGNLEKVKVNKIHTGSRMTGMELSEAYYNEYGRKMIDEGFSAYKKYMAIGLVGEGSDCMGFDDEISESHDFGPGFCIWLPDEVFSTIGFKLKDAYHSLPKTFKGKRRMETTEGIGRVGVHSTSEFYKRYIGCTGVPKNNVEWLFSPETSLATATNGKIFEDNLGQFTEIRNGLLAYYPKDVLLKKLVARMAMMSQAGQYNYERSMKRNEFAAAYISCAEFVKATVSAVYLLNRKYMPFYKWMFRGMNKMEHLAEVKTMLEKLIAMPDIAENTSEKVSLIEEICIKIRDELLKQGIISGNDSFLNSHTHYVMSSIADEKIRSLPIMFDGK